MFFRRSLLTALFVFLFIGPLVAACGSSTSPASSSGTTPTTAATPTSATTALLNSASVSVKGQMKTVLTNAQGMTLYYDTKDTATTASCATGCITAWPPLLFSGSGTPTSGSSLPGTLSVVTTANGPQVEYQGHLLYTFSGDTAAGQANGEGLANIWHVATADLQASKNGSIQPGY